MPAPNNQLDNEKDYQLVDFGQGEKLERFGSYLVRRQSLYANQKKALPGLWKNVDLAFDEKNKRWETNSKIDDWKIRIRQSHFLLKPTPVGHLGIFPEQQDNWNWIQKRFSSSNHTVSSPLKALNLFAYTGGTTMALAQCGIEVVHLDGAANTVKWARNNAASSGLTESPIRWIAEDALRFVKREITRNNHYDILVADPPSFGRGPKKEQWKIDRDFPELLDLLPQLMPKPKAIILSCHTEGFDRNWIKNALHDSIDLKQGELETLQLRIATKQGRSLESGECVRWMAQ